jgi:hypothetical protein
MSDLIDRARALRAEMLTSEVAEQQLLELIPDFCDALERWKFEAFECAKQRDKASDTLARALGHAHRRDVPVELGSVIAQSIAELVAAEITSLRSQLAEAETREQRTIDRATRFEDLANTMSRQQDAARTRRAALEADLAAARTALDEAKAENTVAVLMAARDAARACWRQVVDENDPYDEEMARHWSATAGWLKHRADKIRAGEEPDWPDSARQPEFTTTVTTGLEPTDESSPPISDELQARLDEMQRVRDRGAAEGANYFIGGSS